MSERTLIQLFESSVNKYTNNPFLWEKLDDTYVSTTYGELHPKVHALALSLSLNGVNKGDRIALISEGCNNWVLSELGIIYSGAINVPISIKILEHNDLKFRLEHSGCKMVFVSGNQLHKIREIKRDLPDLEKVVVFENIELEEDELYLQDMINEGFDVKDNNSDYAKLWSDCSENDVVNICYTSGTTADPKGIMLTHRNYTANTEQALNLIELPEKNITLLILPWDHSFAHTAGIYTYMKAGASLAAIKVGKTTLSTLKNIPTNIKEIQPTQILSVPTLAKNFRKNIEKGIADKKADKLFNFALKVAYSYNKLGYNKGGIASIIQKPLLSLFDKILFSKIRENFGGRLEYFIGGGALLDIELQKFFYAIGMPMFQGYGLSEAAPVISSNYKGKHKLGSSGVIVSNLSLKILDNDGNELPTGEKGEIVVKGENVMKGYWRNESATNETIRDGWLYTGDLGYVDNDNFLYVLGRFKSLLIGDDGEKFSPEGIEEAFCEKCSYIDQVMLYNNQNRYTVALIVPNFHTLNEVITNKNLKLDNDIDQKVLIDLVKNDINMFKQNGVYEGMFPTRWLPSVFAILGEEFSEHNSMINSTMKMVRNKIEECYKLRLDYLYTEDGHNIYNHQNRAIITKINRKV